LSCENYLRKRAVIMPLRLSLKHSSATFLLAASVFVSSPAMAGFQWVAPNDPASAPAMAMPQEMSATPSFAPAPATGPEIISPVVITGGQQSQQPQPMMQQPMMMTQPMQPAPMQVANNAVVLGFARSVPLAVALRQILPSGYAFSIDQDVDMGTLVSFQGGKPWRDTLRDTLAPAGLVMREEGQMISVGYATHGAMPMMTAPRPQATAPTNYQSGAEPRNLAFAPVPQTALTPPPAMELSPMTATPDMATTETWSGTRGEHLRKILEDWSRRANVEFDWLSEYDYPLQASVSFSGNFEGAVRMLLAGFEGAHPQPVAELHSNPNMGQMVLVVRTRGNPNSD
jgi:hypothetical protein